MTSARLTSALALAVCLAGTADAHAGEPWDAPFAGSPQAIAKAAASHTAPAGTGAITLLKEITYRFDAQGRPRILWRRVIKVLTDEGARELTEISAPWSPWFENPKQLRVRTIAADGSVTTMLPSAVTTEPAPTAPRTKGQLRDVSAPLPNLRPGVVVEEMLEVGHHSLSSPGGGSYRVYLTDPYPARRIRVVVDAPARTRVRQAAWHVPPAQVSKTGGRVVSTYELRDREPGGYEFDQPYDTSAYPQVMISAGASWAWVAHAYNALLEPAITAPLPAAARVPRGGARSDIIADALARLHGQVRDSGLALYQAPIAPQTPAASWSAGVGDSLDLSVALVAILRDAGIEARVALMRAAFGLDISPALPGGGQLDDALVYLPGKKPMWIVPTDRWRRPGELPLAYQGRRALVIGPGTKRLVSTPTARARDNHVSETRHYYLADYGTTRVVETSTYRGDSEGTMRADYATTAADEIRKRLVGYAEREYFGSVGKPPSWSQPDDLSQPFSIEIEMVKSTRADAGTHENEAYLPIRVLFDTLPPLIVQPDRAADAASRKADLQIHKLYTYEVRYVLHVPAGWRVRQLPDTETRKLEGMTYEVSSSTRGATTEVRFRAVLDRRRFTADQVRTLRAQVRGLIDANAPSVVLEQIAMADLGAGRIRAAVDALRAQAAATPDSATPLWRQVTVLLAIGLREPARVAAEKAVRIDPSAMSYAHLGWVLSADEMGRERAPGYDRAGAIKALEAAVKLDREDSWSSGHLGLLYAANPDGHALGGDLDKALPHLRAAAAADADWNDELNAVLSHAHQWKELLGRLGADPSSLTSTDKGLLIAAIAAQRGADAAVTRAHEIGGTVADALVTIAVSHLCLAGDYAIAKALLARANATGSSTAQAAAFFGKIDPWKKHLVGKNDPRRVAQLALVYATGLAGGDKAYRGLQSRSAREVAAEAPDYRRMAYKALRERSFTPTTFADTMISGTELKVAETRPWGVRIEWSAMGRAGGTSSFVVREGRGYRLVSDGWPIPLAAEALRRLRAGDVAGARGWLTWAHAQLPYPGVFDGPFRTLWSEEHGADADALERAAAALLVSSPLRDQVIDELGACPDSNPRVAAACGTAMLHAAVLLGDARRARRAFSIVSKNDPNGADDLSTVASLVAVTGDWDILLGSARRRLKQTPDDARALMSEASALCGKGTAGDCHAAMKHAVAVAKGDTLLNMYAWQALIAGVTDDTILDAGKRAVSAARNAATLNTLAAVYAARGDLKAAYRELEAAVDSLDGAMPRESDWLVLGRIAATCGYRDHARVLMKRVSKPKQRSFHSDSWDLAQHWLDEL